MSTIDGAPCERSLTSASFESRSSDLMSLRAADRSTQRRGGASSAAHFWSIRVGMEADRLGGPDMESLQSVPIVRLWILRRGSEGWEVAQGSLDLPYPTLAPPCSRIVLDAWYNFDWDMVSRRKLARVMRCSPLRKCFVATNVSTLAGFAAFTTFSVASSGRASNALAGHTVDSANLSLAASCTVLEVIVFRSMLQAYKIRREVFVPARVLVVEVDSRL